MTLLVSFGGHLRGSDFNRLHRDVQNSDQHILEITPIAKTRTNAFETPQSFERFRGELKRHFTDVALASWKEVIDLARLGRFHTIRMGPEVRNDPMAARLIILSEENERRVNAGKPPIGIHFEPLTENVLSQALAVGAYHNNADLAFGKGDYRKFVENTKLLIEGRVRHYELRNRQILELAERLHTKPDALVTADLGALHRHHFERIGEESSIPVELRNHGFELNPIERLIDRVAQGHPLDSISEEEIARAGVSGVLLPGFRMNTEAVDRFMASVSHEDIRKLFNTIRGSRDSWNQVLGNWILEITHRTNG